MLVSASHVYTSDCIKWQNFDTECDHMAMMFIYVTILYIASYSFSHQWYVNYINFIDCNHTIKSQISLFDLQLYSYIAM